MIFSFSYYNRVQYGSAAFCLRRYKQLQTNTTDAGSGKLTDEEIHKTDVCMSRISALPRADIHTF